MYSNRTYGAQAIQDYIWASEARPASSAASSNLMMHTLVVQQQAKRTVEAQIRQDFAVLSLNEQGSPGFLEMQVMSNIKARICEEISLRYLCR